MIPHKLKFQSKNIFAIKSVFDFSLSLDFINLRCSFYIFFLVLAACLLSFALFLSNFDTHSNVKMFIYQRTRTEFYMQN